VGGPQLPLRARARLAARCIADAPAAPASPSGRPPQGPDAKRKAIARSASKGSLADSGEPVAVAKATAKRKAPAGSAATSGGTPAGDGGDDQPSKRARATPSRLSAE
jgi:hypothetical protein